MYFSAGTSGVSAVLFHIHGKIMSIFRKSIAVARILFGECRRNRGGNGAGTGSRRCALATMLCICSQWSTLLAAGEATSRKINTDKEMSCASHTHIYSYDYFGIYIYMCVCVTIICNVCMYTCVCTVLYALSPTIIKVEMSSL